MYISKENISNYFIKQKTQPYIWIKFRTIYIPEKLNVLEKTILHKYLSFAYYILYLIFHSYNSGIFIIYCIVNIQVPTMLATSCCCAAAQNIIHKKIKQPKATVFPYSQRRKRRIRLPVYQEFC